MLYLSNLYCFCSIEFWNWYKRTFPNRNYGHFSLLRTNSIMWSGFCSVQNVLISLTWIVGCCGQIVQNWINQLLFARANQPRTNQMCENFRLNNIIFKYSFSACKIMNKSFSPQTIHQKTKIKVSKESNYPNFCRSQTLDAIQLKSNANAFR